MRNKYKLYMGVLVAVFIVCSGLGYASFHSSGGLMQEIQTLAKLGENNDNNISNQENEDDQGNQITTSSNGNGSDDNFIPEPNIQYITGNFLPVITQSSKQPQIIEKKPKMVAICNNCNGTGMCPCYNCGGDGWIENSFYGKPFQCVLCEGTGKLKCDKCGGDGLMEFKTKNIIDPNKIRG